MQLSLYIRFSTDGDYGVRQVDALFDQKSIMYHGADIQYQYKEEEYEEIWFMLLCSGDANACRWAARDLLQALAVSFNVTQSHYWLVKRLYDFVITPSEEALWSDDDVDKRWTIGGNYEGSEVSLHIKH